MSCIGGETSQTTDHDVSFWRLSSGRQRFVQQTRTVSRSKVHKSCVENLATTMTCAGLYFDSHHKKRAHFSFSFSLLRYSWSLLRQLVIPSNCKAPITSPNSPTIPNKDNFLTPLSTVYSLRYINFQNYILNCKKNVKVCYQGSIL
jgi:hypothetical protein